MNKNVKKEEIKELEKELSGFSKHELPVRAKEDSHETEKLEGIKPDHEIEKILKLKCNYKLFKNERTSNKMFVPNCCELCSKPFEDDDNIYFALTKNNNELFICKKCSEGEDEQK